MLQGHKVVVAVKERDIKDKKVVSDEYILLQRGVHVVSANFHRGLDMKKTSPECG